MLRLMLNIGMQTSERFGIPTHAIAESRMMSVLTKAGFSVRVLAFKQSGTERTACLLVQDDTPLSRYSVRQRIQSMSEDLHQDCIAAVPVTHGTSMCSYDQGQLIGPYNQACGEFDPQFFLEAA